MMSSNRKSNSLNGKMKLFLKYSPYALILFTVLSPDIILFSLPALRLEQLLMGLVVMVELWQYGMGRIRILLGDRMVYLTFGIIILIILSTFNGMYNGYDLLLRDFFGIYKIVIYLGTYFVIKLNINTEKKVKNLLYFLVLMVFISSLIAITQYFNFFNMNELYIRTIAPTQFKTLVNGYPSPRVIGITANPNTYALFLGIAAMVMFNYFLYSYKIQFLLGTVYFFVIMNMTKSRTGFIFFVIGIMVLFFMKSVRNIYSKRDAYSKKEIHGKFFRVILILFLILVVFIAFIFLGPEQLTWRLKKGLDITNDKSFMTRIVRWKQYVEIFRIRLILGIGTTKISPFVFQVDNEWLSHLKEYGLLGTGYFLYVFMYPLFVSDRLFNKDLYLAVLIGALFFMMTSVFFTIFQLIPIVMTLAALSTPLIVGLGDEER